MRKIRIFVSDPHATDSSSDEEGGKISHGSKKQLAREIIIDSAKTDDDAEAASHKQVIRSDQADQVPTRGANPRKKYVGIRRRNGRYAGELRDPIRKKRIWVGTFDTAEEACEAWMAKKIQFEKEVAALLPREAGKASNSSNGKIGTKVAPMRSNNNEGLKPAVSREKKPRKKKKASKKKKKKKSIQQINKTSHCSKSKKIKEEDVLMEDIEGSKTEQVLAISNHHPSQECPSLREEKIDSSHGGSCIMTKRSVLESPVMRNVSKTEEVSGIECGREGDNSVKFYRTYRSPTSVLGTESWDWYSGGSETSTFDAETMHNKEDSVKGLIMQDPNGQDINFSMMSALPIIDNHGFLLGKWSWIDDLSIRGFEETYNV